MKTIRSLFALLVFLAPLCDIKAQVRIPGPGGSTGAAAYAGPGDLVANPLFWNGLRPFTAAYATALGKLANVCIPLDALCSDVVATAAGGLDLAGSGLTCNNGLSICTVKTLYDQTGSLNCDSGIPVACDQTQATIANRPTLVVNCIGSLPCMNFTSGQQLVSIGLGATSAQPHTYSIVTERNGAFSSLGDFIGDSTTGLQTGYHSSADTVFIFGGSALVTATATDSVYHAIQSLWNGASSALYVDGSNTTGSPGTAGISHVCLGGVCAGNNLVGQVAEFGAWSGDKSASFSALNSNQHTYWGF